MTDRRFGAKREVDSCYEISDEKKGAVQTPQQLERSGGSCVIRGPAGRNYRSSTKAVVLPRQLVAY